jgi:hypothetical protein
MTCQDILSCSKACLSKPDFMGCSNQCAANAPPAASQQFYALETCLYSYCVLDATAQQIGVCVGKALNDPNECQAQAMSCQ